MTATFPPPWSVSTILNYRNMFKEVHGRETKLTDTDIWDIYNSVFCDENNKEQDKLRVEEMKYRER